MLRCVRCPSSPGNKGLWEQTCGRIFTVINLSFFCLCLLFNVLHHVLSKHRKVQNLISLRAAENCSELSAYDFYSPQLLSILSHSSSEHGLHRIRFLKSDPSRCWSRKRMDQHGWSPSIDVLNRIKRYLVIQVSFWRSAVTDCVCVSKHSDSSILIKLQLSHWFLPRTRTDLISAHRKEMHDNVFLFFSV